MLSRSNGMKWHINGIGKKFIKSHGDEKESRNEKQMKWQVDEMEC